MTIKRLNLKNLSEIYYTLEDAEKLNMIERVKKAVKRKSNFIQEMQKIADKNIKHYLGDFYIHDIETVHKFEEDSFIWIVRDSGSHLINLDSPVEFETGESGNMNYFNAIKHTSKVKGFYHIDRQADTVKKIKEEKAVTIIETEFEKAKKHYSQFA